MTMTTEPQSRRHSERALRFTFSYEGAAIRLLARHRINVRPPASDLLAEAQQDELLSAFWVELHDANQRPLYRRILHNPLMSSPAWGVESALGVFYVVVPNLPAAETLVLYGAMPRPETADESPDLMLSVPLQNQREI